MRLLLSLLMSLILIGTAHSGAAVERSEIPDKYKWDRTHMFATDADWEAAKARVAARIPTLGAYEGRLGESAAVLFEALDTLMSVRLELERVSTYASMFSDEDSRNSLGAEMDGSASQLWVDLGTATAYMQPELIAVGRARLNSFLGVDARLEPYRPYLDDIMRWAPHTLSPAEEKLLAGSGRLARAGSSIYSTFTNAELPYPEVTLSDGETVLLDASGYSRYRSSANRDDRILVFQTFWGRYQDFRRTLATSLDAGVNTHAFYAKTSGFESSLERSLFNYAIPVSVYHQLIADVHANLPTLHRYLQLKQRMLGLEQIGYEDLYASSVKEVDLRYTPEEAIDLCVRSSQILGEEYATVLGGAFDAGWMDIMPSPGKRSGAYSTMVYDVHPYQLTNFNGGYDDVSTIAHEAGHSMHSYFSAQKQPYVTSDYSIFVAEVASTLNENLLLYSVLEDVTDPDAELFLLGNALENFRTTLFRQAMFAEFELAIHEKVEQGEPLTGDNLNELYLNMLRTYYGHDAGVCTVDELYSVEWAYIPHLYYNFYLYQYSTSMVAGTSLAKNIREGMARGDTGPRDAYLGLLSAGSSKYPIQLLQDAGVDMTTPAPFAAATQEMNDIMDRMEAILAKR